MKEPSSGTGTSNYPLKLGSKTHCFVLDTCWAHMIDTRMTHDTYISYVLFRICCMSVLYRVHVGMPVCPCNIALSCL